MSSELTKEFSETSLLALANKVKDPNDLTDDKDDEKKSLLNGASSVPIKAKRTDSSSNALTPMQKDQKQFGVCICYSNISIIYRIICFIKQSHL